MLDSAGAEGYQCPSLGTGAFVSARFVTGRKAFVTAGCLAGSGEPVDGIRSESRCLEGRVARAGLESSGVDVDECEPSGAPIWSSTGSPYGLPYLPGGGIRGHRPRRLATRERRARRRSVSSVQTVVHVAMAAHQPATFAGVAQSVEHLFCKQAVRGSSPLPSSNPNRSTREVFWRVSRVANGSRL